MYYKSANSIGVRQKTGDKRQVFQFGGLTTAMGEWALRGWADDVLVRLDSGKSVASVKQCIGGKIQELKDAR